MDNLPNFAEMFNPQLLYNTIKELNDEIRALRARVKSAEAKLKEMENASKRN